MCGPGQVMDAMNNAGFEIQHEENFRRHYAMTLSHWSANLDDNWDAAVADIGLPKARTWRLYLAVSRVGFDINRIELHQFLGTKTTADGESGYPGGTPSPRAGQGAVSQVADAQGAPSKRNSSIVQAPGSVPGRAIP